jgi:flagellar hook-basal body complex protein FliE
MRKAVSGTAATRDGRSLLLALRKAAVAIEKASAAAAELQPDAAPGKAQVTRHSRDLTVAIASADVALQKAKKIAATVMRHSRDL